VEFTITPSLEGPSGSAAGSVTGEDLMNAFSQALSPGHEADLVIWFKFFFFHPLLSVVERAEVFWQVLRLVEGASATDLNLSGGRVVTK
jgi:hypothetical protein